MGIIQSITSYFYPNGTIPKIKQAKIRTSAQRLILCIKNVEFKLQDATFKLQIDLAKQIKKDIRNRGREAQQVKMATIIKNSKKLLAYEDIIYHLKKIQAEAHTLEVNPSKISSQAIVAICSLIYVYEHLELQTFIKLNEFIPEPYPTIHINEISAQLQKYHSQKLPTHYELNIYATQFIKRNKDITMDQLNLIGHHFQDQPQQPILQSPSAQMFRVSLAQQQEDKINS